VAGQERYFWKLEKELEKPGWASKQFYFSLAQDTFAWIPFWLFVEKNEKERRRLNNVRWTGEVIDRGHQSSRAI
jgi:hypothetical protein